MKTSTTQKQIKLKIVGESWIASQLVNGKPDQEIVELFGTHELPTAFTKQAKPYDVVYQIAKMNPGVEVTAEKTAV